MKTRILIGALAVLALLGLAACKSSSTASGTHPSVNSSVSAAAHTAEAKGLARLEHCLPNGQAIVPSIEHGTASFSTYLQIGQAFGHANLPTTEQHCLGGTGHPFRQAARKFGACLKRTLQPAVNVATQPFAAHPFKDRQQLAEAGGQATLNVAATCIGRL